MQEPQDEERRHPADVGAPGGDGAIGATRRHDNARTEQHREDGDELTVREHGSREPHPPVDATKVTVRGRVPARQTGQGEELDVNGKHPEDADATEDIEGLNPCRRCRCVALPVGCHREDARGRRVVVYTVVHSPMILNPCDRNIVSIYWSLSSSGFDACRAGLSSLMSSGPPGGNAPVR